MSPERTPATGVYRVWTSNRRRTGPASVSAFGRRGRPFAHAPAPRPAGRAGGPRRAGPSRPPPHAASLPSETDFSGLGHAGPRPPSRARARPPTQGESSLIWLSLIKSAPGPAPAWPWPQPRQGGASPTGQAGEGGPAAGLAWAKTGGGRGAAALTLRIRLNLPAGHLVSPKHDTVTAAWA